MNQEYIDFKKYKYGAYARKSSESEDKQMQSIERQIEDLLNLKNRESLNLVLEPLEESQSAHSLGRPYFNQLVRMTDSGEINAWLCWHPNRLSRNPVDAGMVIHLMDQGKLHHIRTPGRVYYNTSSDKMMLQFEFLMSKKDSDDKSEAVRSGLRQRYQKGLPNGKATLGFLNDKSKEKGYRGWLVDTDNFEKISLMLKRFLKGNDSITSIYEYAVNELKLMTPKTKRQGGVLVQRSHVYNVLINPIYAGFFFSKNEDGTGVTKRLLDTKLPRILTEDEHNKILTYLGRKTYSTTQKHERTYSSYIFGPTNEFIGVDVKSQVICDCKNKFAYKNKETCSLCGVKIEKMKSPKYLEYTYYYNVKRRKTKGVTAKIINESKIDEYLNKYIDENLFLSPELASWVRKHLVYMRDAEIEENQVIVKAQSLSKETLEKEKRMLRDMYRKEMISEEEYKVDLAELEQKYNNNGNVSYVSDWFDELNNIVDLGVEMKNIINNGTVKQKKDILSRLRSNLVWDEENLSISNVFWMDTYIKGRKEVLSQYPWFEPRNNLVNKRKNTDLTVLCPTMLPGETLYRKYLHLVTRW
jgi:site-specific DNA recombinase